MLEPDQESHENENKVEPSYAVSHFRVSHSGSYIKEERSPIASILPHCKRLRLLKAKYSLGRACWKQFRTGRTHASRFNEKSSTVKVPEKTGNWKRKNEFQRNSKIKKNRTRKTVQLWMPVIHRPWTLWNGVSVLAISPQITMESAQSSIFESRSFHVTPQ